LPKSVMVTIRERGELLLMSQQETDLIQIPRELFERFIDAMCYAA